MKVTGIIVEYNPFHYGHIHHITETKKLTQCDVLIAVMSSHFTQRGEPSIIDKWQRTRFALNYGVDLVIELPFHYAFQSADYFAHGALTLLNAMHIDTLVYGSESNDASHLMNIASYLQIHNDVYSQLVKEAMQKGSRYPTACNEAIHTLLGHEIRLPNDLLAFSYIKEIIANNYPITPMSIERTNSFHDQQLQQHISSATSIRKSIKEHMDITQATPMAKELLESPVFFDDFFDLLSYELLTNDHLEDYHLVEEGIDRLMQKNIIQANSMDEFVQSLTSKRYTQARIQRTILSILINHPKGLLDIDYIRLLGMTQKGRQYLNQVKKNISLPIITHYSPHTSPLLDLEFKATKLYSQALPIDKRREMIEKEYKSFPIMI